ncbi:MAG: sterol desaturase family protein [Pseudomonadota bacterium]
MMILREDNSRPYVLETTWDRVGHVLRLPPQKILVPAVVSAWVLVAVFWHPTLLVALFVGVIMQYFIEYIMHRFLYHADAPEEVDNRFRWLYQSHWGHHDFPNNPNLWGGTDMVFVPVVAACFFIVEWAILAVVGVSQSWLYAYVAVFGASLATYITYEWAHVTAHAAGRKNWLERYITQMHAHHHFHNFDTNYHVNAGGILVDKTFGTAYSRERHVRMGNIRTMGLDPDDARLIQLREEFADKYNITSADRQKAMA